jgi:hypothetical protein
MEAGLLAYLEAYLRLHNIARPDNAQNSQATFPR